MAAVKFACPYCNRPLKGNSTMQGKTLRCPACQNQITIPAPSAQSTGMELPRNEEASTPLQKSSSGRMAKRQWGSGRPIAENTGSLPLEDRSSPPLAESRADVERFTFTKDPASLTGFLKVMLWILSGLSAVAMFSGFAQLSLISSPNLTPERAQANDLRQGAIAIAQVVAFIVTGIAFLMWIYRANVNCRGFGASGMKFTAGWSVGYYFIPFLNLYKPYYAMKEIWQASRDPKNWPGESTGPLLGLWWALWIISNSAGQIAYRISARAESIESIKNATILTIVSDLVDIPLCMVAALLVATIYSFQMKLVQRSR